jgi:hypothetical protein
MSEVRNDATGFLKKLPVVKTILRSAFIKQYKELASKGKVKELNPIHFLMNLMGMVVFPFIASPIFKTVGGLKDRQFNKLMQERKKLIPIWVKAMLKVK